jgi:hypothetical protein
MRTNPHVNVAERLPDETSAAEVFGKPIKECAGKAAMRVVKVSSDLKIQNNRNFEEWLSNTQQRCGSNHVFWVLRDSQEHPVGYETVFGEISKYTVYEKVRDKVPNVYISDSFGIPLRVPN